MKEVYVYLNRVINDSLSMSACALKSVNGRMWSSCFEKYALLAEKLDDEESRDAFLQVVKELLIQQADCILEDIKTGCNADMPHRLDIVDRKNTVVIKKDFVNNGFESTDF